MEGFAVRLLTLSSIGDHDVLLDDAHDLLNSIVELSGQHNQELIRMQSRVIQNQQNLYPKFLLLS